MIAARLQHPLPAEPFADDAAGLAYFATDFHYEHLVGRLRRHLAATRGFYLVSGTPAPDGDLIERAINARKDAPQRATLVRCCAGMTVDAVTRAYARQLGLADEEGGGQWSLLLRLMEDSRKGVMRALVLENADALDDSDFDELHRFATLDDPHFLPVVLLAQRSFAQRLDAPSLQFLQPAIVAHLALQHLETEEVAAFIRYQLNATEGRHEAAFSREAVAAIAAAAKGDPAAVNRLARQAAGI
ncbi:MAG TPA: AAA family ATPase, partial [Stellaceae bacterium]|nr:AAA family ATPase [Stellaceae bacterium]